MAPSTIRKAIGAVKDQTSISLAKVVGNVAPDLEVLVVKATTHDNEAADDKYAKEILNLMSSSRGYVNACVFAVTRRLSKTSDWIVALKALVLVHKLLNEGGPVFRQEMLFASTRGTRVLNMAGFRDDAHSTCWDHSAFVRTYALYLDQRLETMAYGRKLSVMSAEEVCARDEDGFRRVKSYDDLNGSRKERNEVMWLKDLAPERVLERLNQLLRLLDRFLASRPTGAAKSTRMVLVGLHLLVKDSFRLYDDIHDVLQYLMDCFLDLEYTYSAKAFDGYLHASKMIDDLIGFYGWVKDVGIIRFSEIPKVVKISNELLGSLEVMLREKANRPKSFKGGMEEESVDEIKALPPPENHNTSLVPHQQAVTGELVNLKNDGVSDDEESNKLAVSLFSEWVEFPKGKKVNSAWENPAAERGREDWEVVLVESASNLSMQQAELGGGFDPLLLNGMYDHGTVKQQASVSEMSVGSASSVTLSGMNENGTGMLALPAPMVGGREDPFAASLLVPPPSYVQMADLERKQQLLAQEQQLWQHYASNGMQGQLAMAAAPVPQHVGLGAQKGGCY